MQPFIAMPAVQKVVASGLPPVLVAVWDGVKVLFATAFALNPHYVLVLACLFGMEVLLGTRAARRRGAAISYRAYARANTDKLVENGCFIGLIVLVFNLDGMPPGAKTYALLVAFIGIATIIAKRHFSKGLKDQWVQITGPILHQAQERIPTPAGEPDVIEHTIVTQAPAPAPPSPNAP